MIIIIPLTVLGVIAFLLIGWGTMIAAWLWSHAVVVGIIIFILHGLLSLLCAVNSASEYSILGLILSLVHSVIPVITLITAYDASFAEGGGFTVSLMLNWIIIFFVMIGVEWLFLTAMNTDGGRSYGKFILFSILNIGASALLLSIVKTAGMV